MSGVRGRARGRTAGEPLTDPGLERLRSSDERQSPLAELGWQRTLGPLPAHLLGQGSPAVEVGLAAAVLLLQRVEGGEPCLEAHVATPVRGAAARKVSRQPSRMGVTARAASRAATGSDERDASRRRRWANS